MRISIATTCVAAALMLGACRPASSPDEITVTRINIVDERGTVRLVLTGTLPDPVVRGERIERAVSGAGIIWHDEDGNESGGIVTSPVPGGQAVQRGLVFDFTHQPTDAVSVGTFESVDGSGWMGGMIVHDRIPYDAGPVSTSQGVPRIMLGTQNADAGLTVLDPQGRERIRIGVDPDGNPSFEVLDEAGEVIHQVP